MIYIYIYTIFHVYLNRYVGETQKIADKDPSSFLVKPRSPRDLHVKHIAQLLLHHGAVTTIVCMSPSDHLATLMSMFAVLRGFPKNRGYPKSSKSLDHFSIETHGDLGCPHFRKPLYMPCFETKNYPGERPQTVWGE